MKRIARIFLVIIAVLFAAYFCSIDYLLKAVIESEGSKALRAKLDIGGVTFHIVPMTIRLNAVQVTNPRQPLRNIIEFETLSTPLSIDNLAAQKIDIPELQVHGLRFNTERAQSGAIAGLTPIDAGAAAPALPATAQLVTQQKQQLQDDLNKTKQDLTVMRDKWRQRLQQLPDDNRIEIYRQRVLSLRSGNRSAEIGQLRQELSNELGSVRKLADEFALDMQHTRAQLAYAPALPQRGGNNFGSGPAPQDFGNIAGALLGSEFSAALSPLLQQLPALIAAANDSNAPLWPLLIRKAMLDGQLDLGSQPLLFTGAIDNLTPQPKFWNVATAIALDGAASQPSRFNARGNIDLRKTASIDLRFDLREFPLQQLVLSKNPQLGIAVKHALADIQGLLSLTGNQLDVNLLSRFQQAALAVQAADDPSAQAVAAALRDVTDFDLNLQISGAVQKPSMKLDSNLNQRLAAAVSQSLQAASSAAPDPSGAPAGISSPLQQQLAPDLTGVQQLTAEFDSLQRSLSAKQAALQQLMDL